VLTCGTPCPTRPRVLRCPSTARPSIASIDCRRACSSCGGIFDYDGKREQLEELDAQAGDPDFWNDADKAQAVSREQAKLKKVIDDLDGAGRIVDDARTLFELGREENDEASLREAWEQIEASERRIGALEFRRMLSGEYDDKDAILSINAGAGGVDSQDWAEMLMRMYMRWGERQGYAVKLMDVQEGEQAGIRSAELMFQGEYAYGHLRSEVGVHRLVRISPFDANARRQTSFTSVMVVPDIGDAQDVDVEVKESDLRVDKYRAGGKGGQHVNKTDSAVRLTHLPTGIVVACQAERSQHKNYDTAMHMLKARLWNVEREKREAEMAAIRGETRKIEWGSQIRSYVLQPYRQVNDHRTGVKLGNVDAVLDGELEPLIEAFLIGKGAEDVAAEDDEV
jgi:peptide chain release factor 2